VQGAYTSIPTTSFSLQIRLEDVHFLVIDEKSTVSLKLMSQVDQRLRQIRADRDNYFGGISIVLCGDFYQLAPVGDEALSIRILATRGRLPAAMLTLHSIVFSSYRLS